VQNLLQNAVKYSPSGGLVTVRLQRQHDRACLAISDQGIGIPEAAQAHLFQQFYRAANVEGQQIQGMGIGLYVVKEIVTLHDGKITVASREGEGSTFTLYLPLYMAHPAP
jgi:signal transduction histidine kinase